MLLKNTKKITITLLGVLAFASQFLTAAAPATEDNKSQNAKNKVTIVNHSGYYYIKISGGEFSREGGGKFENIVAPGKTAKFISHNKVGSANEISLGFGDLRNYADLYGTFNIPLTEHSQDIEFETSIMDVTLNTVVTKGKDGYIVKITKKASHSRAPKEPEESESDL